MILQVILNPLELNLIRWFNLITLHSSPNVSHYFKVIRVILSALELHDNFGHLKYLYLIT